MVRILPEPVTTTVAQAMDLAVLSQNLDRALLAKLDAAVPMTISAYCDAYRQSAHVDERARQIELIVAVGTALDRYVKKPLIRTALAMMRQPARAAGLGALQDLLERGFAAFARMHGAETFLSTVKAREKAIMAAIFAGNDSPFPDPVKRRAR